MATKRNRRETAAEEQRATATPFNPAADQFFHSCLSSSPDLARMLLQYHKAEARKERLRKQIVESMRRDLDYLAMTDLFE